jgi:isocitrate/isopropylmalate dehydrogenase
MMLDWLGRRRTDEHAAQASRALYHAVDACLTNREVTRDLGGNLDTLQMGRAVTKRLNKEIA